LSDSVKSTPSDIREYKFTGDHAVFLLHRVIEKKKEKRTFYHPPDENDYERPYKRWVHWHVKHNTVIDMNVPDWPNVYAEYFRKPGLLILLSKDRIHTTGITLPISSIWINEGEQAFCYMHPVSLSYLQGDRPISTTRTWVLGKKTADGNTEASCVFPGGMVVPLVDVDKIGDSINKGYL